MPDVKKQIADIINLLEDMNENQLGNVYKYVSNEYDEENHEERYREIRQGNLRTMTILEVKMALLNDEEVDIGKREWVQKVLQKVQSKSTAEHQHPAGT